MDNTTNQFKDKVILVTGGTGSIGSALIKILMTYEPRTIRVLSRDQNKQHELMEELGYPANVRMFIGDIRDDKRLDMAFGGVNIVMHAAALKHVPSCEYNPFEAVKTNVIGSQNVIDAALRHKVERVIGISTDKVVNPTSVMGVSKLMMERLFVNANYYRGSDETKFACVRFGNVAWSRGSVMPTWKKQIEKTGEITITGKNMTRYFMSIDQAAQLVLKSAELAQGGEIFVLKMPSVKLTDLAKIFIAKHAPDKKVRIRFIGNRGGEKTHEELLSDSDSAQRVFENKDMCIIVPRTSNYLGSAMNYPGFRRAKQDSFNLTSKKNINLAAIKKLI